MKHSNNHIALLIAAVFVTIFVYGLYGFMYHGASASLENALTARDQVKEAQSLKDQEKNLEEIYQSTAEDRATLSTLFIPDSDKVVFIETLESLGDKTGAKVTLSSISADDLSASTIGSQGHIITHLDVEGNWASVMKTLIYVENLQYRSILSKIHMTVTISSDPKDQGIVWNLSFILDTLSAKAGN